MGSRYFLLGNIKAVVSVVFLVLLIPVILFAGSQAIDLISRATLIKSNLTVDFNASQGVLARPWAGLSQGGEQERPGVLVSLAPVEAQIKDAGIKYIRIDHVLEEPFNTTYKERIQDIINAGAIPIISLSYFPRDVASSDVGTPTNWANWQEDVRKLVEDVSGRGPDQMNVAGVYYEVWNEPDGPTFGDFTIGPGTRKDYFELYTKTVQAVESAQNVNSYKIAGPSLADLRRCSNGRLFICTKYWLDEFLTQVENTGVRLDAITWHKYATKLSDYREDVNFILDIYKKHPNLPRTEKIITEFGSRPERHPVHNTNFDAAHLVAAAASFVGHVDLATKFEVRDGPDSGNQGWGILYHDGQAKPTYEALRLLNLLRPERLALSGTGTYISGLASKDARGVTIVLANYDAAGRYAEIVPLNISNLQNGTYRLRKYAINGRPNCGQGGRTTEGMCETTITIRDGRYSNGTGTQSGGETMLANSVWVYDLELQSRL